MESEGKPLWTLQDLSLSAWLLGSKKRCPSDTIPTKNGRELVEKWVSELMTNF